MSKELQVRCMIKIIKSDLQNLIDGEFSNKVGFLLLNENNMIKNEVNNISELYNIIDRNIQNQNYKSALRYSCILKMKIEELKKKMDEILVLN